MITAALIIAAWLAIGFWFQDLFALTLKDQVTVALLWPVILLVWVKDWIFLTFRWR